MGATCRDGGFTTPTCEVSAGAGACPRDGAVQDLGEGDVPIDDLTLLSVAAASERVPAPAGFRRLEPDLNAGTKGRFKINVCYRRGCGNPVVELELVKCKRSEVREREREREKEREREREREDDRQAD